MINFRKNQHCPSSEKLLAFQKGETRTSVGEFIKRHLTDCEFCSAEVELYARYPQSDDPVGKADIPPYLFELAEALLTKKGREYKSLNKLISEADSRNFQKI
jgi:hypothetical protein